MTTMALLLNNPTTLICVAASAGNAASANPIIKNLDLSMTFFLIYSPAKHAFLRVLLI